MKTKAFTLAEVKNIFPLPLRERVRVRGKKSAFTLAEVLITLGIVGVVAVMTMPTVIKNIQHKSLESQFKKSYSQLAQVIEQMRIEYGTLTYDERDTFNDFIESKYKKLKTVAAYDDAYINSRKTYSNYTAGKGIRSDCFGTAGWYPKRFISADGSFIATCNHDYYGMNISFDTNGYKGPNKFGYDIFFFKLNNMKLNYISSITRDCVESDNCNNTTLFGESTTCSKNSTKLTNGTSCVKYAMTNTCPDDSSKKYWECLP